jgi:membrane protease subunit (stomatin/prohibitin family)
MGGEWQVAHAAFVQPRGAKSSAAAAGGSNGGGGGGLGKGLGSWGNALQKAAGAMDTMMQKAKVSVEQAKEQVTADVPSPAVSTRSGKAGSRGLLCTATWLNVSIHVLSFRDVWQGPEHDPLE